MDAKEIEKREKQMGEKKSFWQSGIILWRVWDFWAKKLEIDLRSRETIEKEKSGDLDTFLEENQRSQDAQDFNQSFDPYDYVDWDRKK